MESSLSGSSMASLKGPFDRLVAVLVVLAHFTAVHGPPIWVGFSNTVPQPPNAI